MAALYFQNGNLRAAPGETDVEFGQSNDGHRPTNSDNRGGNPGPLHAPDQSEEQPIDGYNHRQIGGQRSQDKTDLRDRYAGCVLECRSRCLRSATVVVPAGDARNWVGGPAALYVARVTVLGSIAAEVT